MPTIYRGPLDVKNGLSLPANNYQITLTRHSDCFLCEIERTDKLPPRIKLRTRLFGDRLRIKTLESTFRTKTKVEVPNIQALNGTTQVILSLDDTRGYLRTTIFNQPHELTQEEIKHNKNPEPSVYYTQEVALPQ